METFLIVKPMYIEDQDVNVKALAKESTTLTTAPIFNLKYIVKF